jgi:hypothetical protein
VAARREEGAGTGESSRGEWIRRRGGRKKKRGENERKKQGQFRFLTISIHPVKLFCQVFFKISPTPPEPELFW